MAVEIAPADICEEDIACLPDDFRILLKSIGTGTLASHPPNMMGYHVFNVSIPYKPDDQNGDYLDWLECPEEVDEWHLYIFKNVCLLLRCRLWMGVGGVEGEMGLWIPPSDHDELYAWEASRLVGEHDWWKFLNFSSSPKGGIYENQEITIFFAQNTFFDQDLRVLRRISISESDDVYYRIEDDFESLNQGVQVVIEVFKKHLNAKVIDSID
ncbi:MAG: hypothetical protein WCP96_09350 [Methylococcaceae bacterium]